MNSRVIQSVGWVLAVLVIGWVFFVVFWTSSGAPPAPPASPPAIPPGAAALVQSVQPPAVPMATPVPPAPALTGPPVPAGPVETPKPVSPDAPRRPNYVEKWDYDFDKKGIPTHVQ